MTLYVFTKAFRDACVKAALYAVFFIILFLAVTLRSPVQVLAALAPLVMGTLWTLGLMHVFGIDLNLANTIFMPLVVGAGVEYGIIIVQRWKQSSDPAAFSLPVSTGMGVVLAGLSTTVGFCSLMISRHRAYIPSACSRPSEVSASSGRRSSFCLPCCMPRNTCGPGRKKPG